MISILLIFSEDACPSSVTAGEAAMVVATLLLSIQKTLYLSEMHY